MLSLLQEKLNMSKWHLFGTMVSVTSSETPDCVWLVTEEILSSPLLRKEAKKLGPVDFGFFLHTRCFLTERRSCSPESYVLVANATSRTMTSGNIGTRSRHQSAISSSCTMD
jgi:hypothetical protein